MCDLEGFVKTMFNYILFKLNECQCQTLSSNLHSVPNIFEPHTIGCIELKTYCE